MPILHSFEESKLEYKDEDDTEIKMMGTRMNEESLKHNLYCVETVSQEAHDGVTNARRRRHMFLALGFHLEEIHMTWAHLEKKQTRLRLYTIYLEEIMLTERGDGVAGFKRRRQDFYGYDVIDLTTASRRSRLKPALEDSTWRRRHDYNTTPS
ncbi:hypothetical protein Tco_0781459 [Tanacetum coccineum]